jgi:hypothetical protein
MRHLSGTGSSGKTGRGPRAMSPAKTSHHHPHMAISVLDGALQRRRDFRDGTRRHSPTARQVSARPSRSRAAGNRSGQAPQEKACGGGLVDQISSPLHTDGSAKRRFDRDRRGLAQRRATVDERLRRDVGPPVS